jgi:class 3 adenylate cyclase
VVNARLQTIAAGGEVIVCEQVYQATAGAFYVEEGEPVQVKGLAALVRPYRGITSLSNFEAQTALPSASLQEVKEQGLGVRE